MMNDRQDLQAVLRSDFMSFVMKTFVTVDPSRVFLDSWHLHLIVDHLERVRRGEITRLIINLPPRSLKSIMASVAFPAFLLGHDPARRIICASYSSELAFKHARDCRAVMESRWYRDSFPRSRINPSKRSTEEFETTAKGFRLSTSVGGTLTGRGGSVIIIDDPIKPQDALSEANRATANGWYENTLYSRLDDKRDSAIVLIMQRVHIGDMVAHVLEKESWVHLNLPAIATTEERFMLHDGTVVGRDCGEALHPAREPLETLENIKSTLGDFFFSAQYQQEPVAAEGNLIKRAWLRRYSDRPPRPDMIAQSWDTASSDSELSDYSVGTTWIVADNQLYLIDLIRERMDYPTLRHTVKHYAQQYGADTILIENKGSGMSLLQDLDGENLPVIWIRPDADKVTRMATASVLFETGTACLPAKASWLDALEIELLAFPHSQHDDQVDSISQFLNWYRDRQWRKDDLIAPAIQVY